MAACNGSDNSSKKWKIRLRYNGPVPIGNNVERNNHTNTANSNNETKLFSPGRGHNTGSGGGHNKKIKSLLNSSHAFTHTSNETPKKKREQMFQFMVNQKISDPVVEVPPVRKLNV